MDAYLDKFADKSVMALVRPSLTPLPAGQRGVQVPKVELEAAVWNTRRARLVSINDILCSGASPFLTTPRGIWLQREHYRTSNGCSIPVRLVRQLGLGGASVHATAVERGAHDGAPDSWLPEEMDFYHGVGVLLYPDNASILGRKQSYPTVDTNNRTKDRISTSGVPLIDGSAQFHNLVEEGAHEPVPVPNDAFSMQNSHQTIEAAEINSSWVGALLHVVRVGPDDEPSQILTWC